MNWDEQFKEGQGRYYPAEELVRFLGRKFGSVTKHGGKGLIALEIGCGVGGNIKALADWGFFIYGLDISQQAIKLAREHASIAGFANAVHFSQYTAPDSTKLPSKSINLCIDIQTIQHLSLQQHEQMYKEVHRVLHPGCTFFSVHWAGIQKSREHIFPNHPEIDGWHQPIILENMLETAGFRVTYFETVVKTYGMYLGKWAILEAVKE